MRRLNMSESDLISYIYKGLINNFGDRFSVYFNPVDIKNLKISTSGSAIPDICVIDKKQPASNYTFIEVKGEKPTYDLPMGTISVLNKMKNDNKRFNPNFILVSGSSISPEVEAELTKNKIVLLKEFQKNKIVSDLVNIIYKFVEEKPETEENSQNGE
jgi:hypothetical protein